MQRSLEYFMCGGSMAEEKYVDPPLIHLCHICLSSLSYPEVLSHKAQDKFGGGRAQPNASTSLDFYIPDDNDNRLSQLKTKNLGMLSKVVNPLVIIKYWMPFFGVDKLTGNLHTLESNCMVLIIEKSTIILQLSDILRMHHLDSANTFIPFLGTGAALLPWQHSRLRCCNQLCQNPLHQMLSEVLLKVSFSM